MWCTGTISCFLSSKYIKGAVYTLFIWEDLRYKFIQGSEAGKSPKKASFYVKLC